MFELKLLPEHKIVQVNNDGKRHYVVDGEKIKFDSVTTFLSMTDEKEGLELWKYQVGDAVAEEIANTAKRRGNIIHKGLEDYILGNDFVISEFVENFNSIKEKVEKHLTTVYGLEHKMYSKSLELAGTTDLIGVYKNKLSIVDFKGSNKPKRKQYIDNYIIQTLIYAKMFEELYNKKIEQLVILVGVNGVSECQEFIIDIKEFPYYERLLEYRLKKRKRLKEVK